jgi:Fe-S cluster assembly ATP-binding protein
MLKIQKLHAGIEGKQILNGIDLVINPGEVHAIMGPNGSGKSTLAAVLAGREQFEVTDGTVDFFGKNLLDMAPEQRASEGLFLAFQYPVEIPGLTTTNFIKTAVNEIRKYRGEEPLDAVAFLKLMKEKMAQMHIDKALLNRSLNEGFSGGEKKRNEIFQMMMLQPKLAILDETDSGLDIDAIRIVANGVNQFRSRDNAVLVVTHYQRLLNFIVPDFVHVLYNGRIVKSGTKELALELEEKGYEFIKGPVPVHEELQD